MIFNKKKKLKTTPIHLLNTLSGEKEVFKPLTPGKIRMYNCGPTVYSEQHIGNMRAGVFADILRRVFEYNNYEVQQVINITDVGHMTSDSDEGEDKMEKRAKEDSTSAQDIAKRITKIYLDDLKALGVDIDKIEFPRATDYIDAQIELTKTLVEKGYAYVIDRGVAFDTSKFKDYGKLGNINMDNLKEGARVKTDKQKYNSTDFWLWKLSDKGEKRQQEWDSPWGKGFPGWHIECTAMSRALLGRQLDVHTGGIEHVPIHHNNEIAQSEALSGKKFVNYWLHNAHLMLDGKKISKSIGNVIYLRQLMARNYSPLALRYFMLNASYNSEQNFTWEALDGSSKTMHKLKLYYIEHLMDKSGGKIDTKYKDRFTIAINDNVNTPRALAIMWELIKDASIPPEDKKETLLDFDRVLGLQLKAISTDKKKLQIKIDDTPQEVVDLLEERKLAREEKDWAKSDELRDKIKSLGYKVVDKGSEQRVSTI